MTNYILVTMELRCLHLLLFMIEACLAQYMDYTTLLLLSSTEGQDPYDVWQDTGSTYNSATNMTISALVDSGTNGYRNTMIDNWATVAPDSIRVCYRNDPGYALFCMYFNSTGSTSLDWLSTSKMTSCSQCGSCDITRNIFSSYSSSFPCSDSSSGVLQYYATSLVVSGGSVVYLVATSSSPQILPVAEVSDSTSCFMSYQGSFPFVYNQSVTGLNRLYCSSVCRENNKPYGAVHPTSCSCLGAQPTSTFLSLCTYPCDGDNTETCGGVNPDGFPGDAIIFNYVNTNVDVTQFNTPLRPYNDSVLSNSIEISFTHIYFLAGYDVTVTGSPVFPLTIVMEMRHVTQSCSSSDFLLAAVQTQTFTVDSGTPVTVGVNMTRVRCVRLGLSVTDNSGSDVSIAGTITPNVVADDRFVTAKYISIDAAWELELHALQRRFARSTFVDFNVSIDANDTCDCDCWVYNLLYGESPYDNLTYEEIEKALFNVTQQIIKELSVNTSGLSSTIRKKTSADDDRPSATAVGYALGVAMLTVTFGGLVLSDLSRVLGSMRMMKRNLQSRFGDDRFGNATVNTGSEPEGRSYSSLSDTTHPSPSPSPR